MRRIGGVNNMPLTFHHNGDDVVVSYAGGETRIPVWLFKKIVEMSEEWGAFAARMEEREE